MKLIEIIDRNIFLKKLYPSGFDSKLRLGDFMINEDIGLSFFTKEKPIIEISKWGKWGVDYNCIEVRLTANLKASECQLKNREELGYCELLLQTIDDLLVIEQKNKNSLFLLKFNKIADSFAFTFRFDKCNVYLEHD